MKKFNIKKKIIIGCSLGSAVLITTAIAVPVVLLGNKPDFHSGIKPVETADTRPIGFEIPNEDILPGVRYDATGFNAIKKEQTTFQTGSWDNVTNVYHIKNRWTDFVFEKDALKPELINGEENALKIAKLATSMMIISSSALISPPTIEFTMQAQVGALGSTDQKNILIYVNNPIFKRGIKETDDDFNYSLIQVINHENGHRNSQTLIRENNLGLEQDMANRWKSFIQNTPYGFKELLNIKDLTNWTAQMSFHNLGRWTLNPNDNKSSFVSIIASDTTEEIKGWSNPIDHLPNELLTRIQLMYTQKLILPNLFNLLLLGDLGSPLKNHSQIRDALDYNFFDENDSLQAYNIMKQVLKYYYGIAQNNAGLQINAVNNSFEFQSEGGNADKINVVKVFDGQDQQIYEFNPQHDNLALGFSKNPFEPDYQYKYVTPAAWYAESKVANLDVSKIDHIKVFDLSGNELSSIHTFVKK